jgi:hypothetical protein
LSYRGYLQKRKKTAAAVFSLPPDLFPAVKKRSVDLFLVWTIRILLAWRRSIAVARSWGIPGLFIAGLLLILALGFHLLLRALSWAIGWLTALLRLALIALIGLIGLICLFGLVGVLILVLLIHNDFLT